jgi:hypothetical protein
VPAAGDDQAFAAGGGGSAVCNDFCRTLEMSSCWSDEMIDCGGICVGLPQAAVANRCLGLFEDWIECLADDDGSCDDRVEDCAEQLNRVLDECAPGAEIDIDLD